MKNYYYTDSDNRPVGPVPFEELIRLSGIGTVRPATYVVEEGRDKWISFSDLKADGVVEDAESFLAPPASSDLNAETAVEDAQFSPMRSFGAPVSPSFLPKPEEKPYAGDIVPTSSLPVSQKVEVTAGGVRYDPATIQQFAEKLYGQAKYALVIHIVSGIVFSIIVTVVTFGIGLLVFPFIIGASIITGLSRDLALRTQAQTLLCQMKIEENTRKL